MNDENKKINFTKIDSMAKQALQEKSIEPSPALRRGLLEKIAALENSERQSFRWLAMPLLRPALILLVCGYFVVAGYLHHERESRNNVMKLDMELLANLEMYEDFDLIDNLDLLEEGGASE